MRLKRLVFATLLTTTVAGAHGLWVFASGDRVEVVFEHAMTPGDGDYNEDILTKGKTWVRTLDSGKSPVKLSETGPAGARYFAGTTQVQGPRSVEHYCLFGLYGGRLNYFYGRYLDVDSKAELEALASAKDNPIDVVLSVEGDALNARVMWDGEPLKNHRVWVHDPDGEETSVDIGADGVARFKPSAPGRYGVWGVLINDEIEGVHEGDAYTGTVHSATTSIRWPLSD